MARPKKYHTEAERTAARKAQERARYVANREAIIQRSLAHYYTNHEARKASQRVRNAANLREYQEIAAGIELEFATTSPEHRRDLALSLLHNPDWRVREAARLPRIDYRYMSAYVE